MILTENIEGRNLVFDFIKAQSIAVADAADLKAKLHECYNRVTAAISYFILSLAWKSAGNSSGISIGKVADYPVETPH